jgi:aspartyl-tRNA(Asn)/glutamyl-tRNA(Gln) amidotransferase subunit C
MDVKYVAELAKIKLNSSQINKLENQFNDILSFFKNLEEVDTKNIQPYSHVQPLKNVTRDDQVGPSLKLDEVLKNAPNTEKNFFKVPKVIK